MSTLLRQLFSKYLIITNTVTNGSLLGLGDVITQNLEIEYASRMGTPEQMFDTSRTGTERPLRNRILSLYYVHLSRIFELTH